jgi:hypothetical protein
MRPLALAARAGQWQAVEQGPVAPQVPAALQALVAQSERAAPWVLDVRSEQDEPLEAASVGPSARAAPSEPEPGAPLEVEQVGPLARLLLDRLCVAEQGSGRRRLPQKRRPPMLRRE